MAELISSVMSNKTINVTNMALLKIHLTFNKEGSREVESLKEVQKKILWLYTGFKIPKQFCFVIFSILDKKKLKPSKAYNFWKIFGCILTSSPFSSILPTPSGSYKRSSGRSECSNFFFAWFVRSSGSMESCTSKFRPSQ